MDAYTTWPTLDQPTQNVVCLNAFSQQKKHFFIRLLSGSQQANILHGNLLLSFIKQELCSNCFPLALL